MKPAFVKLKKVFDWLLPIVAFALLPMGIGLHYIQNDWFDIIVIITVVFFVAAKIIFNFVPLLIEPKKVFDWVYPILALVLLLTGIYFHFIEVNGYDISVMFFAMLFIPAKLIYTAIPYLEKHIV